MSDESKTLDMHCEACRARLVRAYDAMAALSAQERRVVLDAADSDSLALITSYMATYRTALADTLRQAEERGKQAEDSIS